MLTTATQLGAGPPCRAPRTVGTMSALSALSVKELRERAAAIGIGHEAIEDARDGDSPKSDIIALIESREKSQSKESVRFKNNPGSAIQGANLCLACKLPLFVC